MVAAAAAAGPYTNVRGAPRLLAPLMSHSHARGELTSVRPPQLDRNFWKELNCCSPRRGFRAVGVGKGGRFRFSLIKWRVINGQIEAIGRVGGGKIGGRSTAEAASL